MKKNTWKRRLSLLLAGVMLLSTLVACGESAGAPAETPAETPTETSEEQPAENPLSFPLEDPVTLKVWAGSMTTHLTNMVSDYNETPFFQELEKRTNVHIEFETISSATAATEAFNLMISSGELPDIIFGANLYSGGLDAAVEDGYYLDLTPYLDTYMPNFNARRHLTDETMLDTTTDAGRVVSVQNLNQERQSLFMGLMLRKDWLDADGLEVPETLEEWETVLTSFKENHGATAPLALTPSYYFFTYGFNATTDFIVRDGKVIYSPTSDNMKEALTVFSDWYKKGLIDPDFMSREGGYAGDMSMIVTGQSGVFNVY